MTHHDMYPRSTTRLNAASKRYGHAALAFHANEKHSGNKQVGAPHAKRADIQTKSAVCKSTRKHTFASIGQLTAAQRNDSCN